MNYYVDCKAKDKGEGSLEKPFLTISEAASCAMPGDTVIVRPGIYREYVDPKNAGTEDNRIAYVSERPLEAVITGSEQIKNWEKVEGTVWKAVIPNSVFGSYNPYTTLIFGDWYNANFISHTGEVFLNQKSLYEVTTLEAVKSPVIYERSWDSAFSVYTWYTCQDTEADATVLYANFHEYDPNAEDVEINVRENCFYPSREGIGFITLSGFTVRQAATKWAPPTAYQEGMIGPHWSKGWIIEDCDVSLSKCSGISLGKYLQPNNENKWSVWKFKDGTQTERDAICQAVNEGWTKENIGSHIIRRCNIHDCGQTGIVGHLGGVFSLIEDNHIHHINNKNNLSGAEIAGIKMHAAIDCIFRHNHIHHCTRGMWLDWQAQGTRVTGNLFHDNTLPGQKYIVRDNLDAGEDIFVEVSHGPTLIDHNILLSDYALKLPTQGYAIVHNLIAGSFTAVTRGVNNGTYSIVSPRYTPYHVHHRTEICGFMSILYGDARFYNNIFIQKEIREVMAKTHEQMKDDEWTDANLVCGINTYEEFPTWEEYAALFRGYCGIGSPASDRYYVKLPIWTGGNVYFNGAVPNSKEKDAVVDNEHKIFLDIKEDENGAVLCTNVYDYVKESVFGRIETETLGLAFEPEQKFENPDGSEIIFDKDYFGNHCGSTPIPGPFADGKAAKNNLL